MKHAPTLALLAMAAAVTATALVSPAEANTGAASATTAMTTTAKTATTKATTVKTATTTSAATKAVRYGWLDSCTKGEDYAVPCGPWMLTLRSGKTVKLTDAAVFPRKPNGKIDKENNAPIAVSGDGTRIVYFRKSDSKLVWKNISGGTSHSLPGKVAKIPKGFSMDDLDPLLSFDGDMLVIDYNDEKGKQPTLAVDLRNGDVAKLPGADFVQGFSPDGRRILVSRSTSDNTTEFAVFDTDGDQEETREVPQVVSNNTPIALANDGVTVGVVITPSSGKPRLRQYDLSTDAVSPAIDLAMPAGETAYSVAWDNDNKLTLWRLRSTEEGDIAYATASRVNPSTGALKKIDSFKIRSGVWTWWLPGE